MPSPSSVVALLVSHDGARWLPAVIEGLRGQTRPVDRVVAVDTGSKDESAALLAEAFGEVRRVPGATTFPQAVREGLAAIEEAGLEPEWIWILHDDANPDPRCLEALLAGADGDPEAGVLGPKLREWPSLRRLLELGVTISGTGRRETGLERGEYDQGQHDQVRPVLAVNTAGMLVRRSVLRELGGFDEHLPIFGNDLDFGWRAAAAGHRTIVVPDAVVFHAEAAHRGVRRTPLTGRHTHYQERRAALWTLLVNSRGRLLPLQVVRLVLGTLLRMIGFLLVRSVGEALDELAALVSVLSSPRDLRAARRERASRRTADDEAVRRLLPPWWLPYRHGLDFASDLLAALTHQAADVAERRRVAAAERDPSSFAARRPVAGDDELEEDTGLVARFVTNPVAVLLAVVVVVALVGARAGFGGPSGGGLSPVPEAADDWWGLYLHTWHAVGPGTDVPAPAYLLPLAALATLLLGSPGAAVSAVLVLAVPLALWGAWRFLRVVGRLVSPSGAPRWLILWGATTYALVPVVSGAWGDGRLGVVLAAGVLPWLAHAALGFADPEADRRWRAAWRTGLLLALVVAFLPVAWLVAVSIGLVVVAAATLVVRSAVQDRSVWGPPATAVGLVPVLLVPWWLPAVLASAPEALLLDAGRLPGPGVDELGMVLGRFADLGAPWWLGLVPPALAVAALVPRATRIPVLVCWMVALVAALVALALSTISLDLAGGTVPVGLGFPLLVVQGAFVVAAVLGGQGLHGQLRSSRSHAARPARAAAAGLAVLASLAPVVGLAWFVGGAEDSLTTDADFGIPAYMQQNAEIGAEHGILMVRGSLADGLNYDVRRGDGTTVGEDEILALAAEDAGLTRTVRTLLSRPTPEVVDDLAARGIQYVVLAAPADPTVAAGLDASGGLEQASAEDRATRAWQVESPPDPDAVDGPRSWLRIVLLVVQGLAVVAALVLAAPTTERSRR